MYYFTLYLFYRGHCNVYAFQCFNFCLLAPHVFGWQLTSIRLLELVYTWICWNNMLTFVVVSWEIEACNMVSHIKTPHKSQQEALLHTCFSLLWVTVRWESFPFSLFDFSPWLCNKYFSSYLLLSNSSQVWLYSWTKIIFSLMIKILPCNPTPAYLQIISGTCFYYLINY